MVKKRLYPLLLALCLLAGCGSAGTDAPEPAGSEIVKQEQQAPPPEAVQTPAREPEPEPEPEDLPPTWDEAHRLPVDYTPARSGSLELPLRGATGYAAVELPLWEAIPEDPPPENEVPSETAPAAPETTTAPAQPEQPPSPPPMETTPPSETPTVPSESTGEGAAPAETAPAETETPPVETFPAPEAPAEAEPPAQTEGKAAENEAAPTEGETAPAEGETTLAEGEAAPAEETTAPPADEAKTQNPSTESGAPPEAAGETEAASPAEATPPSQEAIPTETTPSASTSSAETATPPPAAEGTPAPPAETPAPPQAPPTEAPPTEVPAEAPLEEADPYEGALAVLAPGTAFTVLEQDGDWWRVEAREHTGWIEHRYCMINLPDVIPSIIYDAINSYDSRYRSVGKPLPDITGRSLYPGKTYNLRLDREEFMMPVLYAMAVKLCRAQQAALAEGNSLILYEGYRPYSTQRAVVKALTQLSREDPEVEAGIATKPWNLSWFIATGYSNHQRGSAVDMGLAKVLRAELASVGDRAYPRALEWEVYEMPTPIHELSIASVIYTAPNSGELVPEMNEPALGLQRYCTGAGLSPLSSEWWHFDDWAARRGAEDNLCTGGFQIDTCLSRRP